MSVGPISGAGNTDIAALQKQLQADQKQLETDRVAKASDQQLAVDPAPVQRDDAAATAAGSAPSSGGQGGLGGAVDLYL